MSSLNSRCAACKHLRRRCPSDCIFSPYFPANNPQRFASVHKIYGASNIAKILQKLPVNLRAEAADSLCYEAQCRIKDPVYGSVGIITLLHQQIYNAQTQLAKVQAEIAVASAQHVQPEPLHDQQQQVEVMPGFDGGLLPDQVADPNDPSTFLYQNQF